MKITKARSIEDQASYIIKILQKFEDHLLLLSGGKSPAELYFQMSNHQNYELPQDMGQIDERWGNVPMHQFSNYKMIKDSGLLVRIEREGKNFHPILIGENTSQKTAALYDSLMSNLFVEYAGRIIGIFGVSIDGHTAGITAGSPALTSQELVVAYESGDEYGERITLTAEAIKNHVDVALILLNSKEKLNAFKAIMKEEDVNKYPALVFKEMQDVEVICISQ